MSDIQEVDELEEVHDFDKELDQLINNCKNLEDTIHKSYESLHNIKHMLGNNINVLYNEVTTDFYDVLNTFHKISLENINKTGKSNFGEQLLNALHSMIFL